MTTDTNQRQIFSVSELNRSVRQLLEMNLPLLWVEGEISNFAKPGSGHWYLTLKDEQAQVRCAMFRNTNQRVNFKPANGTQVLVRCRAGLYEGRGEYQLIIEHMEEAGFGALQRRFDQLKVQLDSEGLFDQRHKKTMPASVTQVGIVTSATGAAIKDILSVLQRRFPAIKVSIFPTSVQGEQAAGQIIEAIANANRHGHCDALIVGRGGGSLEDLWPFNEEKVARAIFNSHIPIISAVGHEIDFTIADLVADLRAPTPSAAAEVISPDGNEMLNQFLVVEALLVEAEVRKINGFGQQIAHLQKRLQHPGRKLQEQSQHLDHLDIRLGRAMKNKLQEQRYRSESLRDNLLRQHPGQAIKRQKLVVINTIKQLAKTVGQQVHDKRTKTEQTMHLLDTVSPLKTLGRGYSVIRDSQGAVIKTINDVKRGDNLKGQVTDGEISFAVTKTANTNL